MKVLRNISTSNPNWVSNFWKVFFFCFILLQTISKQVLFTVNNLFASNLSSTRYPLFSFWSFQLTRRKWPIKAIISILIQSTYSIRTRQIRPFSYRQPRLRTDCLKLCLPVRFFAVEYTSLIWHRIADLNFLKKGLYSLILFSIC